MAHSESGVSEPVQFDLAELGEIGVFKPHAHHHKGLDFLIVQVEPGTTVSEWVNPWFEILWNVNRTEMVGVKIHAWSRLAP